MYPNTIHHCHKDDANCRHYSTESFPSPGNEKTDQPNDKMSVPRILATHRAKVTIFVGEDVVSMICSFWIDMNICIMARKSIEKLFLNIGATLTNFPIVIISITFI